MNDSDLLGYKDQQVVVTGGSSGIGEAAVKILVELGAEVYSMGTRGIAVPGANFVQIDLKDTHSIDIAIAQLPEDIHSLFNCAGVPGPPFSNFETTMVNFVGHRYLTENLIPRMGDGGAIAFVASLAGAGWRSNRETIKEIVAIKDFGEAKAWLEANEERNTGYIFSKQCLIFYTHQRAAELATEGIRINCLSPITTVTPMLEKFEAYAGKEFIWEYFRPPCDRFAVPEEVAEPLVFLNSNMARFVSGHNLIVDYGYWGDVQSGQRKPLVG